MTQVLVEVRVAELNQVPLRQLGLGFGPQVTIRSGDKIHTLRGSAVLALYGDRWEEVGTIEEVPVVPVGAVVTPGDGSQPALVAAPIPLPTEEDGTRSGTGTVLCAGGPWQAEIGAGPVGAGLGVSEASAVALNGYFLPRFRGLTIDFFTPRIVDPPGAGASERWSGLPEPDPAAVAAVEREAATPTGAAPLDPDTPVSHLAAPLGLTLEELFLLGAQHTWWVYWTFLHRGPAFGWAETRAKLVEAGGDPDAVDAAQPVLLSPRYLWRPSGFVTLEPSDDSDPSLGIMDEIEQKLVVA